MIETSGDAEAQMAISAVSKETVQVVDQSKEILIFLL